MLEAVKTRLETQVPELFGRVGLALDFARLRESGAAPTAGVTCFVLPSGVSGLPVETMGTGLFIQNIRQGVSVVTMLQSTDATGQRALGRIDGFLGDIRTAICGWSHGDTVGLFELQAERPIPGERGVLAFISDFRINDQLRITT
ncbi:phage tail terminator protein [Tropicibacter sp. S64]|uniref:phage tail terminator protein n=1 Tax=Tropicibacter sp. S64 TaxID=3415122 RepID=UPI003C7C44E2